jgi:hypothetical protein
LLFQFGLIQKDVLYTCGIKQQVEEMDFKLDEKISDNGNNLSVGTKQLLCLGVEIILLVFLSNIMYTQTQAAQY